MSLFNNQKKKNANPLLIKKREKDLTRLMSYLDNFNIIGLNGRWGTGKTFIINELKNRVKNQYEFIDIDLMTCNLNEMQPTLIRAFEEVMLKNRILPKYSNKMKNNIATSSIISKIQDLTNLIFTSSDSNSEVLQEFQKELGKLDKKILVIYEDLDRISNKDIIREIFSISERISNENIKIIYQYDESIMVQLKFSPDYLEKYIPFKINITELNFWEILQFELKDIDESILTLEDFKFIIFQEHRFNKLHEFFEHKTEYTLVINYIPIRKVKQMVKEILLILRMNKDIYTDHKETVISFFVLKHLYPDGYEKLDIQESLLETLKFKIDDNYYTILQLIESYKESRITKEKIKDVFSNEQNIENYELLKLFNYEIINSDKFDNQFRLNELETRAKHYNEKIDRVVWNLLYEGKSVFTDNENAVNKFKEMVLTKPLSKQKEAFHDFWGYLFNSDGLVTDNTTIFKIGHSNLLSLFESFKIANMDSIMQIKLIEFYFECNNIKDFNLDVVKCMNLSLLKSTDEYVLILNYLNSLQIVGNLNGKESFTIFLNKYIHALTRLGYIHSYKYFYEINDFVYDQDFMLERFNEILEDLVELSDRHKLAGLTATVIDLNTIFQFVEKIIEILNCDEKLVIENRPFVKTKITSKKQNQEEFDRLKHLFETRDDKNKVIEKIEASYKQKKITLYEIDVLLQEVEQKNTTKF
ncbi:P-loop NTPase fold protein [Pseudogracilibacillus auburnensis]|nr:P-loop NTPase fold protein [Pseudogracilibacillus auburnensis]